MDKEHKFFFQDLAYKFAIYLLPIFICPKCIVSSMRKVGCSNPGRGPVSLVIKQKYHNVDMIESGCICHMSMSITLKVITCTRCLSK